MKWYREVSNDLSKLPDALEFYDNQYEKGRKFLSMGNEAITAKSSKMPGFVDQYYCYLQELEALLEFLTVDLKRVKSIEFRKYLENYQKVLSSRDCEKYVDGEPSVISATLLVNECAMVRNKFLSIHKGLDQMSWMIGHITRLKCAGLDDARF